MEEVEPRSANLNAAVQFVRRAGSPVGLARLDYLLTGSPPVPELRAQLFAVQREDGVGRPSSLGGTVRSTPVMCENSSAPG